MGKRLFVVPVLNTMGPVVDERHDDLLASWDKIDAALAKYFSKKFRDCIVDKRGKSVVISWFPVSWSGFDSNPVRRDFGWFTIYDHLTNVWGGGLREHGDGVYWMYNHPDKSGVGNVWGLDWCHNCHYLNILNRMILQRGYFPGVVEIPVANTDSTNFVEQFFPFEMSNRNSRFVNWDNVEADGRRTRDILQWADAPDSWVPYFPAEGNHQSQGEMKHLIFRVLDIKTRIMEFPREEIIKAFEDCRGGSDAVIAGYEHDFRDRSDAVIELFLNPIKEISLSYPDVEIVNITLQEAATLFINGSIQRRPSFTVELKKEYILIRSNIPIFGNHPYVAVEDKKNGDIYHMAPEKVGNLKWGIQRQALPDHCVVGIAGFSRFGAQSVCRVLLEKNGVSPLQNDLEFHIPL